MCTDGILLMQNPMATLKFLSSFRNYQRRTANLTCFLHWLPHSFFFKPLKQNYCEKEWWRPRKEDQVLLVTNTVLNYSSELINTENTTQVKSGLDPCFKPKGKEGKFNLIFICFWLCTVSSTWIDKFWYIVFFHVKKCENRKRSDLLCFKKINNFEVFSSLFPVDYYWLRAAVKITWKTDSAISKNPFSIYLTVWCAFLIVLPSEAFEMLL